MEGLEMVTRDSLLGESTECESGQIRNEEAALSYFSEIMNTDDDERNWSFSYLQSQLLVKDSSELFRRYQKRVQHALFVEMLLMNVLVNAIAVGALSSPQPRPDTPVAQLNQEELLMFTFRFSRILNLVAQVVLFALAFAKERWFNGCVAASLTMVFVLIGEMGTELTMAIKTVPRDTPGSYTRSFTYYIVFTATVLLSSPRKRSTAIAASVLVIVDQGLAIASNFATRTSPNRAAALVIAEGVFLVVALVVGISMRYLIEVMGRRAFLDRRECLESKMKIENEKDREEKLLESVLPKHIAKEVREDISKVFSAMSEHGQLPRKPFKKLYVDRYEDVSILYADIVNSMLLGASLCVADLVDTLNDLFGRFDEAAHNHNCMRIKLLGDCYYCISGFQNDNGEDNRSGRGGGHHSDNCVRTGLKMINIIRQIRENRGINVDMRIGIHSGNVLGGLLGLRKWQFDIWSKDVTIASHMEQSGVPGHIHITKATRDLLKGNYIIKPGDGHLRDPYLDAEGIRTFLISPSGSPRPHKVMMQISSDSAKASGDVSPRFPRRSSSLSSETFHATSSQEYYDRQSSDRVGFLPKRQRHVLDYSLIDFRKMVEQTNTLMEKAIDKMSLSKRDQWCSSAGVQPLLLTFQEGMKLEKLYHNQPDPLFKYYMLCALFILIGITGIHLLLLPRTLGFWIMFGVTLVFVLLACLASWAGYIELLIFKDDDTIRATRNSALLKMSRRIWKTTWIRVTLMFFICLLILGCSLIGIDELLKVPNRSESTTVLPLNATTVRRSVPLSPDERKHFYTFCAALALTTTTVFLRIHYLFKLILKAAAIAIFCEFYLVDLYSERLPYYPNREAFGGNPETSLCFYLVFVGVILHLVDRQVEYICRLDFVWRSRLQREREEATRVELVNRVLLRNILPRHVARFYLDAQKQKIPEAPFHEECSSVAILFASIPSFANFYFETELNEAGKRCIQFLNEIVCDFDQLLIEKFPKVEKIKTIGSTYMAACGLNTADKNVYGSNVSSVPEKGTEQERKRNNVATLARFSTSMMATLNELNRDAMQEFQIRAGIAVGRVMAGVVGTVKPQYDIWGDAVNVASRMDSTGIPGRIQVTEEVADLLKSTGSFETECRGEIIVKGKGKLTTFFLKTPHDQPGFEHSKL